jgi:hypothetical protein
VVAFLKPLLKQLKPPLNLQPHQPQTLK